MIIVIKVEVIWVRDWIWWSLFGKRIIIGGVNLGKGLKLMEFSGTRIKIGGVHLGKGLKLLEFIWEKG